MIINSAGKGVYQNSMWEKENGVSSFQEKKHIFSSMLYQQIVTPQESKAIT